MNFNLKLVKFETADHLMLPGLLYEPEEKTEKVAIFLHGNGSASVFYGAEEMNLYADSLAEVGVSFFPFNNRGAHWIKKLNKKEGETEQRIPYGMTYELIKECVLDINGAIEFLKGYGYKIFYLIGASTGANKIVVYHYYQPKNPISKYVLLGGGDDSGMYYNGFGQKKFMNVLKKCKEEIIKGRGRIMVPKYILKDQLISYQSLFDTMDPSGDYNIFPFNEYLNKLKLAKKRLFREYRTINKLTLMLYGELDEFCYGNVPKCVDILKKECLNPKLFTFKIITGADHGFTGKEKELIKIISSWL